MSSESQLLGAALAGIALLLFLLIRVKLQAFVALLVASLVIGVAAGMPLGRVLDSVTTGIGSTLATIAIIVGLGAMLGRMLEVSGGAAALGDALVARFGQQNAQWSLLIVGFVVAIPVFFDVAFIILVSLVYVLTEKSGRPIVYFALPLLAGLAVAHAFVPPTPGPIAVAGLLGADLGWVIALGVLIGFPAAVVGGPLYTKFIASRVSASVPEYMHARTPSAHHKVPSVGTVVALIGIPLALIITNAASGIMLSESHPARTLFAFVGNPIVALLTTTILCFWSLGTRLGYSRQEVQSIATQALEPAGIVILVTGAGGVLKQVLVDSGVGTMLAHSLEQAHLPLLVFAFASAAVLRVAQGSATVAMLTAGGLVAAAFELTRVSGPQRALLVIAIAAGATIGSHVNDSGFWLVNRYLGLSVADTVKTWTAMTTIVALVSLVLVLIAGALL
ncbi:MAG: gluconate:H+ symporter [Acidobacteriota bacterium]